jgi:uncharacterized protein
MGYEEHGVRIGSSPNGLGVFALRELAANELLGPIEGTIIDDAEYESNYCMEVGDHSALEPAPPFRYVNHSCCPNCDLIELDCGEDTENASLWLKVKTAIASGEELTIDYAWPAETATPCHCGCPSCRHWIVAAKELHKVSSNAPGSHAPS